MIIADMPLNFFKQLELKYPIVIADYITLDLILYTEQSSKSLVQDFTDLTVYNKYIELLYKCYYKKWNDHALLLSKLHGYDPLHSYSMTIDQDVHTIEDLKDGNDESKTKAVKAFNSDNFQDSDRDIDKSNSYSDVDIKVNTINSKKGYTNSPLANVGRFITFMELNNLNELIINDVLNMITLKIY